MPKELANGKPTTRRYSDEEKAAAVRRLGGRIVEGSRVTRTADGFRYDELRQVRFVPLVEGLGQT